MIRLFLGAIAGAFAMFITGFIFFATPLESIAYAPITPQQQANVQAALAANLGQTGTYKVPTPDTPEGMVMYGKGPIATVHYNAAGFSTEDTSAMVKGLIHELIVCLLIAFALAAMDRRVPDFASRARVVILFSLAASALIHLGDPIWMHQDWVWAIFLFFADAAMLIIPGLIIARWFLPVDAVVAEPVVEAPPQV